MDTMNESRRDFIANASRMVIAAGVATVVGAGTKVYAKDKKPVLGKVSTVLSVDTSDPANAALKDTGGAIYIANPSDKNHPIIVYRKSESEATAFSSKCSHKGGPVGLPGKDGLAVCEWHQAAFDANGEVKKGPAKDHLQSFDAAIADGKIMVTI